MFNVIVDNVNIIVNVNFKVNVIVNDNDEENASVSFTRGYQGLYQKGLLSPYPLIVLLIFPFVTVTVTVTFKGRILISECFFSWSKGCVQ